MPLKVNHSVVWVFALLLLPKVERNRVCAVWKDQPSRSWFLYLVTEYNDLLLKWNWHSNILLEGKKMFEIKFFHSKLFY